MQPHNAVGVLIACRQEEVCKAANLIEREMGLHLPDIGLKTHQASQGLTMAVLSCAPRPEVVVAAGCRRLTFRWVGVRVTAITRWKQVVRPGFALERPAWAWLAPLSW